jgi:hypothetical protein
MTRITDRNQRGSGIRRDVINRRFHAGEWKPFPRSLPGDRWPNGRPWHHDCAKIDAGREQRPQRWPGEGATHAEEDDGQASHTSSARRWLTFIRHLYYVTLMVTRASASVVGS